MKINILFYLLVPGALLMLGACDPPPELSTVPIISFENVEYKQVSGADSLILTIGFEDNEGDLGVDRVDEPPIIIYKTDESGNLIKFGSSPELPPYNVCDYLIRTPGEYDVTVQDTVLIEIDPMTYNIWLKFFRKRNGVFSEFDFRREFGPLNCFTMDGRFFRLNTQPNPRPLQGSLRYGMSSHVFGTTLRVTDTLKIEVQIRDNALNKSQPIETPEFTLDGIRVGGN